MYPSRALNPIAIEHWQRMRLAKDIAFVDAAAAREGKAYGHRLVQFLRQFFFGERVAKSGSEAVRPVPSADRQRGPSL